MNEIIENDCIWAFTVLDAGRHHISKSGKSYPAALVRCSCGAEKEVLHQHLRSGNTKSCGSCGAAGEWRPARPRRIRARLRVRYRVNPRRLAEIAVIRRTWDSIKRRCYSEKCHAYKDYGGRGITMWEPWIHDSGAFVAWVLVNLGPRPDGYSIDRVNNNGNYEPGNLKWSTPPEQAVNTRDQEDAMNGIYQEGGAKTFFYKISRFGEKLTEYGFETPEEAAAARNRAEVILECCGIEQAAAFVAKRNRKRREARDEEQRAAREAARREAAEIQLARDEARDEARRIREQAREEVRQAAVKARESERQAWEQERAERAARWHQLNETMSLGQIARAEGVTSALVCIELQRYGYQTVPRKGGHPFHKPAFRRAGQPLIPAK